MVVHFLILICLILYFNLILLQTLEDCSPLSLSILVAIDTNTDTKMEKIGRQKKDLQTIMEGEREREGRKRKRERRENMDETACTCLVQSTWFFTSPQKKFTHIAK